MSKLLRTAVAVATAVISTSLAACSSGGGGGGDVVVVDSQHITKADFDNRLEANPVAKQVLTQMVQQALIDNYGKSANINPSQSDIDKKENEIKAKYPPGQFDQIIAQQGLTQADVQNILREQIVLEKAVAPQVHVTDAEITAYFAKNHAQLDKPAQVRARHILVGDEQTANMVEAKLKAGGNFADLAKQYSKDPSTKDKGGELGFFGPGQMVPAFQAAAFALPVGATSAPVKSPFGWHIIQVEEKKPAIKASLAASRKQIVDTLTQQAEAQQTPLFLQNLRSKANINVVDSRFASLFPAPPPAAAAPPAAAPSAAPAASAAASPAPAKS